MITIIKNTKAAQLAHGYAYGAEHTTLTQEHITALQNGKCLAVTVNDGEYVVFITSPSGVSHDNSQTVL